MTDEEKDNLRETIQRTTFDVLNEFTETCPDVKMSYDDWMMLRFIMDQEFKDSLGVANPEDDDEFEDGKDSVH